MKVICKENKATNLDLTEVTILDSNEMDFSVEKYREYIVMGIMVDRYTNCIYYLIDCGNVPDWYPYPLFDISDNALPPYWHVKIIDKKESLGDIFYLSGFKELCDNDDYYDALIEGERWTIDIYFKRKREMEEWHNDKR